MDVPAPARTLPGGMSVRQAKRRSGTGETYVTNLRNLLASRDIPHEEWMHVDRG